MRPSAFDDAAPGEKTYEGLPAGGAAVDNPVSIRASERAGDPPVVLLAGEIDVFSAPAVKVALFELLRDGSEGVAIDFSSVTYIDSAGLGVLAAALKRTRAHGGWISIVGADEQIRRIFEITGLTKVFRMDPLTPRAAGAAASS
jgi:anti-sigma B factor antagonist